MGDTQGEATRYDIIIVGGSVAGAAAAIALADGGHRILVVDKATFPRDKPCGEGIMPQGMQILDDLGLGPDLRALGRPFQGISFVNRKGEVARADFPPVPGCPKEGIVIRRTELDEVLIRKAASLPNVDVKEGFLVREILRDDDQVIGIVGHSKQDSSAIQTYTAPLTLGTDGRNSVFHRGCNLKRKVMKRRRFGLIGHLRGMKGRGQDVEVLLQEQGEIYLAHCRDDITLVAILLEDREMPRVRGDLQAGYLDILKSTPLVADRMTDWELVGDVSAIGPLGFTIAPIHRPGLLLIGDSAGFLDPITGEGMTLALKSVAAAVPLIHEAFKSGDFGEDLGKAYEARRMSLIVDLFKITKLVLELSRHKRLADGAIRRLGKHPELMSGMVGVASGAQSFSDLSTWDTARLLFR